MTDTNIKEIIRVMIFEDQTGIKFTLKELNNPFYKYGAKHLTDRIFKRIEENGYKFVGKENHE